MTAYIILGIVLGLPLIIGMFMRVSTPHLFFSLMAGELLARYFADDAELVLRLAVRNQAVQAYAELIVLVLPMIFTALFLRHTLAKNKLWLHFIPLLLTGVVFAAFTLDVMPLELQQQVRSLPIGDQLFRSREVIIGAVIFLQLISLWLINRPKGGGKHEKHH